MPAHDNSGKWSVSGIFRFAVLSMALLALGVPYSLRAADPAPQGELWKQIEPYIQPPAEFAGKLGAYRSPLQFADGSTTRSREDWARRRAEILETWHKRLGPWPALLERPTVTRLETIERDGFIQHHVHVQVSAEGTLADGYLLVPRGAGPFPAVFVPFYEPLTSIGQAEKGRGTHDYGLQLVKRGFVTLSIGTPGSVEKIGLDTRKLLTEAGVELRRQPLTLLAYVAANCHIALAQMPEVDRSRIGIIGLSYGGKWSMFASCLYDKFACAVWSDPGIVFDEKNANVNYWEPWYLGYDPKVERKPGIPSAENPRTGLYKELVDAGDDLVSLHALMAPRPVLVSGGTEDPPRNWQALNHLVAINDLLGAKNRVAMTARATHIPTAAALETELAFLEYWLKEAAVLATNSASPNPPGPLLVRSARSGAWSDPATWEGGRVPEHGVKVHVQSEHRVTYDVESPASLVIRSLHIAGTLTFAPDRKTQLNAGLIRVEDSDRTDEEGFECDLHVDEGDPNEPKAALLVGTPEQPIAADARALIRLTYIAGMNKDSCPAIVCCGGRMDFHGTPLSRTWVKLGASAIKGARELTLGEPVTGWKTGDRIIITATDFSNDRNSRETEQRTIATVDGGTIRFDEPLSYDHAGEGEFRGEVANLSRNVIVESADPEGERGHTMYHRGSAGSISYAEFRHLGKPGVLGRYSLHFHLVGPTMRGSSVVGASIWDSGNRWVTIHGTNYLVVRDCVGYRSVGHGFFLEDGTEVFNVLDRNLAVEARPGRPLPKQVLPFDQNEGAGFWWANSLNTFTRNVAVADGNYGFRYEATPTSALKLVFAVMQPDGSEAAVDIRTLPFVRFEDNEVHSSHGLYGINLGEGVQRVGPDARHPFVVRNTKIWNVHYGLRPQVPSLLVENLTLKSHYGVYHPNFDNHVYRNVTIRQSGTEPFNRGHDDDSVQHGMLTVDGLTFDGCASGGMPLIQISDDNPTGNAQSHFRRVEVTNWNNNSREKAIVNLGGGPRPTPKTEKGVPVYVHDWYGPGRHALVVSTRSNEYKARPGAFRSDSPLTGDESRVTEVADVGFPQLLDPVDDLPPATVITRVTRRDGRLIVEGTCSDNGPVKHVLVNSHEARATSENFSTWEIALDIGADSTTAITAHAEDSAGNVEQLPHKLTWPEESQHK